MPRADRPTQWPREVTLKMGKRYWEHQAWLDNPAKLYRRGSTSLDSEGKGVGLNKGGGSEARSLVWSQGRGRCSPNSSLLFIP